jgi:hypothetical protein
MYSYKVFNIKITSQIPLPIREEDFSGESEVCMKYGETGKIEEGVRVGAKKAKLYWESVGGFVVTKGDKIVVSPKRDVSSRLLSIPLLGPVIGALLFQRGFLVLHASAVEKSGKVTAFLGPKGIGKSTTGAKMYEAGWGLFSDDLLAVDMTRSVKPLAAPAPPLIKLNPDIECPSLYNKSIKKSPKNKRYKKSVLLLEKRYKKLLPLKKIIFLRRRKKLGFEKMGKKNTMINVIKNNYIANISNALSIDAKKIIFESCKRITKKVKSQKTYINKKIMDSELKKEELANRLGIRNGN